VFTTGEVYEKSAKRVQNKPGDTGNKKKKRKNKNKK
jgi:hypothetical protein